MGAVRWADRVKLAAVGAIVAAVERIQVFLEIFIAQVEGNISRGATFDFQFPHGFVALGESVDNIGVVRQSFHHGRNHRHFDAVAAASFFTAKQSQCQSAGAEAGGVGRAQW